MAKSNNIDADGMADIFRLYGDHLYAKGDLDGAIRQYCKTVGKLEASYVVRQVSPTAFLGTCFCCSRSF